MECSRTKTRGFRTTSGSRLVYPSCVVGLGVGLSYWGVTWPNWITRMYFKCGVYYYASVYGTNLIEWSRDFDRVSIVNNQLMTCELELKFAVTWETGLVSVTWYLVNIASFTMFMWWHPSHVISAIRNLSCNVIANMEIWIYDGNYWK